MNRTIVFEKTEKVHQAIDVEYDTKEQFEIALAQVANNCYDIDQVRQVLENNKLNILGVDEEYNYYTDDFEYYDDYEFEE